MKPCMVCGRPVANGSRCASHKIRRPWYDKEWQKISRQRRRDYPICEICHLRPSTQVDHIFPRSLAGGVRAVCRPCHDKYGASFSPGIEI